MKTSKSSARRIALAAVAAMALTVTAVSATPALADRWRHHGWGDDNDQGGWNGGFSFYSGPGYYYAPPPTYYYAPPPPVYYGPPSLGFGINVPLGGRD